MYMSYSNNPHLPRVRMEAVRMVEQGKSVREVARHFGYTHSAIVKWRQRVRAGQHNLHLVPTRSSRPIHHPRQLSWEVESRILALRDERRQCAEILQHRLSGEGVPVSLSSVKRVLRRAGCSRFSKWKKWHSYPPRPLPSAPGMLVELDTVHDGPSGGQLYLYTMLDVCSRWAYALPSLRINTHRSLRFVDLAREMAPFSLTTLQSDHGSEFSKWFTQRVIERGLAHRHTRVRTPNDNAHLERFNRTIQEECIAKIPRSLMSRREELPEYLRYYNEERPHMGLEMKTPAAILKAVPSY